MALLQCCYQDPRGGSWRRQGAEPKAGSRHLWIKVSWTAEKDRQGIPHPLLGTGQRLGVRGDRLNPTLGGREQSPPRQKESMQRNSGGSDCRRQALDGIQGCCGGDGTQGPHHSTPPTLFPRCCSPRGPWCSGPDGSAPPARPLAITLGGGSGSILTQGGPR